MRTHRKIAIPIINSPIVYTPESVVTDCQPKPNMANINPENSSNGRNFFGFSSVKPMYLNLLIVEGSKQKGTLGNS